MAEGFLLTRFGLGNLVYEFPTIQDSYTTNFGQLVTRVSRLPGVDGGFDELGLAPAYSEVGNVRITFKLIADTRLEMELLRDKVYAMAGWGTQRLYMRPSNPSLGERYCNAKVSNISMPQQPNRHTDLVQTVNMDFSVPYPFWLSQGTESPIWGQGVLWGSASAYWGGSAQTHVYTGSDSVAIDYTLALTVNGTALARPRVIATIPQGGTFNELIITGPREQRVTHSFTYTNALTGPKSVTIDCRAKSVTLLDQDLLELSGDYANFDFDTADWMAFTPGVNTLDLSIKGDVNLQFKYNEVYR